MFKFNKIVFLLKVVGYSCLFVSSFFILNTFFMELIYGYAHFIEPNLTILFTEILVFGYGFMFAFYLVYNFLDLAVKKEIWNNEKKKYYDYGVE